MLDSILRLEQGDCALSCVNTTTERVDPIQSAANCRRGLAPDNQTARIQTGNQVPDLIQQSIRTITAGASVVNSMRRVFGVPDPTSHCHWRDARDVSEELIGFVGCEGAVAGRPRR